jgi:hypothetical protein
MTTATLPVEVLTCDEPGCDSTHVGLPDQPLDLVRSNALAFGWTQDYAIEIPGGMPGELCFQITGLRPGANPEPNRVYDYCPDHLPPTFDTDTIDDVDIETYGP